MLLTDPFESEMKDTETYPILQAAEQGEKYIKPAMAWQRHVLPDVDDEMRQEVITALRSANPDTPETDFRKMRDWLWPRLANPGLTRFMLDQGAHSRFFASWLMSIPGRKSLAPATGYGYDLSWRRQRIPRSDPFYAWVIRSPAFVGFRQRMFFAANMLLAPGDAAILGCGDAPELTQTGFAFHPENQQIYMCDVDPEIDPATDFGRDLTEIGVHYRRMDYRDFLDQYQNQFNHVVMNGLMSYLGPVLPIVKSVLPTLKPGGKFIFDLQVEHWELLRAVAVFGWPSGGDGPKLQLASDVCSAVEQVEKACRNLNVAVANFPDTRNLEPTGVIFVVTKL